MARELRTSAAPPVLRNADLDREAVWQTRVDLAACFRMAAKPGHLFLVNPIGRALAENTARAGQSALEFYKRTVVDEDYNVLALDESGGDRIAAGPRDADIPFTRNHGVLVVGAGIAEAWDDLYYLRGAASGDFDRPADEAGAAGIAARAFRQMMDERRDRARRHLESIKRLLDCEQRECRR
jgi:hypothetical protein